MSEASFDQLALAISRSLAVQLNVIKRARAGEFAVMSATNAVQLSVDPLPTAPKGFANYRTGFDRADAGPAAN